VERPVAIPVGDGSLVLEGLYLAGATDDAGGAVIAPPHPLYGGSMGSPVVSELAHAFRGAGGASMCFNWRGVGASAGVASGENTDADADYAAALTQLSETVAGPLAACGYSFGAAAAVRAAAHPRVARLVLVAPPPALLDAQTLEAFPGRVLILVGEDDTIAAPDALEALAARVPGAQFELVVGADHFFVAGLAQIGRGVSAWLGSG